MAGLKFKLVPTCQSITFKKIDLACIAIFLVQFKVITVFYDVCWKGYFKTLKNYSISFHVMSFQFNDYAQG